jgi:Family of unknown function (DUF5995)
MTSRRVGWASATSIDDVLERMGAIEAELPAADGVAIFNRMYHRVTGLVADAVSGQTFVAGEFLERLDVHFANLFFQSYEADLVGASVPPAWSPLFQWRARPGTHPIQFALAGMNAHISHDLAFAVVHTCREVGVVPEADSPEHTDFTVTNRVLEHAAGEIKSWFSTGIIATIDDLGGQVDDGFAMFGIHTARAAAWDTSEMLWHLDEGSRLHELFTSGLARTVGLTSRGIML